MSKVIIFGLRDLASLAHFYLKLDNKHEVVAFTVTAEYLPEEKHFEGVPIVPFENIEYHYNPTDYQFFAPMTYRHMNRLRESIYNQAKDKGYQFISYISPKATIYPGTKIGDNCFIFEDNTIQPYTAIGNNVVLWSGNHIGHHSVIKDHVFFTSHVVLSGHCIVESYSFCGVNATIKDGLHIGEGSFIAMGACITRNTEPWGVYRGNPAKKSKVSSKNLNF